GKDLKKAKYHIFSSTEHPNINEGYYLKFDDNYQLYFYLLENQPDDFENAEIIQLNQTDFIKKNLKNNTYRFEFYGGNDYPVDENGHPKTFEELAKGTSFDRLGILRMDVDNLGKIFAEGFAPELRTFSRLTSLSRNLDFFFKGYLNTIWNKEEEEYNKDTYILYSGGDDLFVLGRWDKIINFAYDVKEAFQKFTNSTEFGITGGIAIEKPKFPIRRGALNAGTLEHKAKDFCIEKNKVDEQYKKPYQKNAFALFGVPLSWQSDFEKVKELKEQILKFLKDKSLPHSFINKLKLLYIMQQHQINHKQNESWRWICAYNLKRTTEYIQHQEVKDWINLLKTSIFTDSYNQTPLNSNHTFLKLLTIAARWAELEHKTETNN
ncbi:MAG: hypothetical protein NC925_05680, partial [Candidatus Omnitrophica bacterium]|nr:hypothetical protein [Candidatus Omnitrophota bacterium]